MIDQFIEWLLAQDPKILVVLELTGLFFCASIIVLLLVVSSKLSAKRRNWLRAKYWSSVQENLAFIAIQSVTKEGSEADYNRSIQTLKSLSEKSKVIRQWILEELINQKANVAGDTLKTILKVYRDLDLKSHSTKKLQSWKWNKKAEGIHELERMDQRETFSHFYRYLDARHQDLRIGARMGLTTLAPNPLAFLDQIREELSEWEQMAIYHRLKHKSREQLPNFSMYYHHQQPTVVAFCIEMTVRFNYFELVPQLVQLLKTSKIQRVNVLVALKELEAFQALGAVRKLVTVTKNEEVIIACLGFLGQIDDETCRPIVWKFMHHPTTSIRMAAVDTAIKLDMEFESLNTELHKMFLHHKNELI